MVISSIYLQSNVLYFIICRPGHGFNAKTLQGVVTKCSCQISSVFLVFCWFFVFNNICALFTLTFNVALILKLAATCTDRHIMFYFYLNFNLQCVSILYASASMNSLLVWQKLYSQITQHMPQHINKNPLKWKKCTWKLKYIKWIC